MSDDVEYDELGFPAVPLSKRHQRRARIRVFTAKNQWELLCPSLSAAYSMLETEAGSKQIDSLVITHGILPNYRADLYWRFCEKERQRNGLGTAGSYIDVLKSVVDIPEEVAKQIELDVPRTFCEQRDFKAASLKRNGSAADGSRSAIMDLSTSEAVISSLTDLNGGDIYDALRRMLRAYCVLHPGDGYLQSMNFIAAFTLLIFGRTDETRAFWCFEFICSFVLKGYYSTDMASLHRDCAVFKQALAEMKPHVAQHLMDVGDIDISALFLPRWLLCAFLNCFPAEIVVRVWDAMIFAGAEGPRVLVEVALAVVEMCEEMLLTCTSFLDVAELLKDIGGQVSDSAELMLLTRTPQCSLRIKSIHKWRAETLLAVAAKKADFLTPEKTEVAVAGSKRRRSIVPSPALRSPALRSPPLRSPGLRSPEGAFASPPTAAVQRAKRASLLIAQGTPTRTPPINIEHGLDRLANVLVPFPAQSPTARAMKSPSARLTSPVLQSPLKSPTKTKFVSPLRSPKAHSVRVPHSTPSVAIPKAATIACALNPSTAHGLTSARKRRELMRIAHKTGAKGIVPPSTSKKDPAKTGAKHPPATPKYTTMYHEYDHDAYDGMDYGDDGNSQQLMTMAPPSAKRPRHETEDPASADTPKPSKNIQLQLLSPKRTRGLVTQ